MNDMQKDDNKKNLNISNENLRKINLFIEITILINIQHYLLNISKNEAKSKFWHVKSQKLQQ